MRKRRTNSLPSEFTALRLEMARRDWTQADLGEAAGMPRSYVSLILRGVRTSKVARHKIEDALGVCVWSTPGEFEARHARAARQMEVAA